MSVKVDGTNNKVTFYAGTANSTSVSGAPASVGWTMTLPTTAGFAGQVLVTDGAGNLSWGAGGGGGIIITDDDTTDASYYPMSVDVTTGSPAVAYVTSAKYYFNPASGQLTAKHMASSGGIHLNANRITENYTLPTNMNGLSAGPITVNPGVTVTVPPSQAWVIV